MDRVRVAIAVLLHLLAASTEMAGHQQPAAPPPATDDQDTATTKDGEWLWFMAMHHPSEASSAHTPLPWVGSRPGADGTTTSNSQEHLAMQASSSLPPLLPPLLDEHDHCVIDDFDLSTGSHGYNDMLYRVNVCLQRYKWSHPCCGLLVAEKEGALHETLNILLPRPAAANSKVAAAPAPMRVTGVRLQEALDILSGYEGATGVKLQEALDILDGLLRPTAVTKRATVVKLQDALDILDGLLRPTAAAKRATGKSLDTDNCNIKNRLRLHAMKGGRKILPDTVNGTRTQTHVTQMVEKNGSTKLKGAARKMAAA